MTTEKPKRIKQLGIPGMQANHMVAPDNGASTVSKRMGGRAKRTELSINGSWKIQSDGEMNFILRRRKGSRWIEDAYFFTLSGCLSYLVNKEVLKSNLADLKSVVDRIEALKTDILKLAVTA